MRSSQAVPRRLRGCTGRDEGGRIAGPPDSARESSEVERLDSEPVAAQKQAACAQIKRGERELTAQPGDHWLAPSFERPQQRLGVAVSYESRPFRLELAAQRGVVVDLTVISDPPIAPRVTHGLMTSLAQVDDRQPRMHHCDVVDDLDPSVIRSAMGERVAHRFKTISVGPRPAPDHATSDSAHALDQPPIPEMPINAQRMPVLMRRWIRSLSRSDARETDGIRRQRKPVVRPHVR